MDNEVSKMNSGEVLRNSDISIKNLIYVIRGQQVMIDNDLAELYQVETRAINQAVKRNSGRFPERFCFQLTSQEYENLKSQFVISSSSGSAESGYGGRRTLPYAFTEQGIAMLSAVLRSQTAVEVSVRIMDAFVEMRRFIASNSALFERISSVELRQLEYQKQTDEKFEKVFDYIADHSVHSDPSQKIFFDGQIYDAFELLISLVQKAERKITLIDGYVDVGTLNILAKKKVNVEVVIYTFSNTHLSKQDVAKFNSQYPKLTVKHMKAFHDRFLILDDTVGYHIGASLKDAGSKCFGINQIQDQSTVQDILNRLRGVK